MVNFFFTADEHYHHWTDSDRNIIKYCDRPFGSIEEMHQTLILNHNDVVSNKDITIHVGDFSFGSKAKAMEIVRQLNGSHVFVRGSHDKWLGKLPKSEGALHYAGYLWERLIDGNYIVACHYAMRTWPGSHYNSWQVYGHSHGRLEPIGRQWDVGVDNNNFYPLSYEQLAEIMHKRPDNFNYVGKARSDKEKAGH